ncbi:MAG: hypothetical protein ACFE0P_04190 [Oceanicaulis sp.]
MRYDQINSDLITATIDRLGRRIHERFPGSGLHGVCLTLLEFSKRAKRRSRSISRPYLFQRLWMGLGLALLAGAALWLFQRFGAPAALPASDAGFTTVEGIEALLNIAILVGAAVLFIVTSEQRSKRSRALDELHRLRSIAHVIDMHQLTKDPASILRRGPATASSPVRDMSEFELTRYLDYCTEMLSLTGKLAGLYAEASDDPAVVSAAGDVERMTTSMASKVWQKIMTISQAAGPA